jgi:hypothetical protein
MKVPPTADYVCLRCGRAYKWSGTPPALTVVTPEAKVEDDENEDG